MRARFYCILVLLLHILGLFGASSSRHFAPPNDGLNHVHNQGTFQNPQSSQITHTSNEGKRKKMGLVVKTEKYKEMKKIGSSPPSCEHKCYGCMPCEAIQVPTTSSHLGVQYTNYEPEGWKCKCGPTFYSP